MKYNQNNFICVVKNEEDCIFHTIRLSISYRAHSLQKVHDKIRKTLKRLAKQKYHCICVILRALDCNP